jgi:hypothetical protein
MPLRRPLGHRSVLAGTLLAGALAVTVVAAPAARATIPKPLDFEVVGAGSYGGGAVTPRVDLFYTRRSDGTLVAKAGNAPGSLGGILTSGVSAMAIASGEFVDEFVYGRGTDGAVWFRQFSDGQGQWSGWQTLGGRSFGAPGATCAAGGSPVVFVTGTDFGLWRRTPAGWSDAGGDLWSDPAGLAPAGGECPDGQEAYVIGGDDAVWRWTPSGWNRVGGQSLWRPGATLLPDGGADLFVVGKDDAVWVAHRNPGATAYGGFQRIGGVFTSGLTAVVDVAGSGTRHVYGLGTDGNVWRLSDPLGGGNNWTISHVP